MYSDTAKVYVLCRVGGGGGVCCFFFFNDTATTEIYTLSLHDALPISTSLEYRVRRFLVSEFGVWGLKFRVWSLGFGV